MQLVLPIPADTRCGYCDCHLTLQRAGDWACSHCRPHLAEIADAFGWELFARGARTARYRKDCR